MTTDGKEPAACREYEMLMMAKIDGEISAEDDARLSAHMTGCAACAKAYRQYAGIAEATNRVQLKKVAPEQWDIYWNNVSNRMERSVAWAIVAAGVLGLVTYGVFALLVRLVMSESVGWCIKAGIIVLVTGMTLLFASVAREKMALRKTDKYRGVRR